MVLLKYEKLLSMYYFATFPSRIAGILMLFIQAPKEV